MPVSPHLIKSPQDTFDLFPAPPILHSLGTNWSNLLLAHTWQPAAEVPETYSDQYHTIVVFHHGDRVIHAERTLNGRRRDDYVRGGDVVLVPAGVAQGARWDEDGEFTILSFHAQQMAAAVDGVDSRQLIPHFATPDPLIQQMGQSLLQVLSEQGAQGRLYAETMATALYVHLLQHYSTQKVSLQTYSGLGERTLRQVVDYIQAHLTRSLGVDELSEIAHLSPHYFSTLFKQSTGLTPHQYVIRCRVERAKTLLLTTPLPIAEIALRVGFSDQSQLTRHCKRVLGATPRQVRRG